MSACSLIELHKPAYSASVPVSVTRTFTPDAQESTKSFSSMAAEVQLQFGQEFGSCSEEMPVTESLLLQQISLHGEGSRKQRLSDFLQYMGAMRVPSRDVSRSNGLPDLVANLGVSLVMGLMVGLMVGFMLV